MRAFFLISLIVLFGCSDSSNTEQEKTEQFANDDDFYWGERIDGPANIRNEPNGEVIFELYDDAEVQVADLEEGESWYHLSVWVSVPAYNGEIIPVGAELFNVRGVKVGVVKSKIESIMENDDILYLEGYSYKDNIKPESLIERALETHVLEHGRSKNQMKEFTTNFGLDDTSQHQGFNAPFIYENFITDPSPGYRLMLLFESDTLQGFYHSRAIELENITTYKLWRWNDRVSFFNDYPKEKQLDFVHYMEEWLQGVD